MFVAEISAKMFSIRLQDFFNQPYLESKSMKQPNSLVDTNSSKLEVDQKFFGRGHGQNGYGQSGHGTLKLTLSEE